MDAITFISCRFDIRLMKEGRMKGQAFVTFPTDEVALKALRCLHGYVLHDRPMLIVSFLSLLYFTSAVRYILSGSFDMMYN